MLYIAHNVWLGATPKSKLFQSIYFATNFMQVSLLEAFPSVTHPSWKNIVDIKQ